MMFGTVQILTLDVSALESYGLNSKFSRVIDVVVEFSDEGNCEEREKFWNDLDKVLDRVDNGYRLCVLGDLNGWVEDRVRVGITGAERGLCLGNTLQAQEFA